MPFPGPQRVIIGKRGESLLLWRPLRLVYAGALMTERIDDLIARCRQPDGPWRVRSRQLSRPDASEITAGLKHHGIAARVLGGERIRDKKGLLTAVATAFEFPSYFGHNWDALLDCLSDFHWLPAKGYVCIMLHADQLKSADRKAYTAFLKVCQAAAVRWTQRNGPAFLKVVISTG